MFAHRFHKHSFRFSFALLGFGASFLYTPNGSAVSQKPCPEVVVRKWYADPFSHNTGAPELSVKRALAEHQNTAWRQLLGRTWGSPPLEYPIPSPFKERGPYSYGVVSTSRGPIHTMELGSETPMKMDVVFMGGVHATLDVTRKDFDHGFLGGVQYLQDKANVKVIEGLGQGKTLWNKILSGQYIANLDEKGLPSLSRSLVVDIGEQAAALAEVYADLVNKNPSRNFAVVGHSYGALASIYAIGDYFFESSWVKDGEGPSQLVLLAPGNRATGSALIDSNTLSKYETFLTIANGLGWGFRKMGYNVIDPALEGMVVAALTKMDPDIVSRIGHLAFFGFVSRTVGMLMAKGDEALSRLPRGFPVKIIVPENDEVVPLIHVEWLRAAAAEAGLDVSIYTIPGATHTFLGLPEEVRKMMLDVVVDPSTPSGGIHRLAQFSRRPIANLVSSERAKLFYWQSIDADTWQNEIVLPRSNAWLEDQKQTIGEVFKDYFPQVPIREAFSQVDLTPPY